MKSDAFWILLCILINLIIGNLAILIAVPDTRICYQILISILVSLIFIFQFKKISSEGNILSKKKLILYAVGTSLLSLVIACIFISVSLRMEFDSVFTAALKGIIPMSVFAFVFASPVWVLLAVVNFFCFKKINE